MTQPFKVLWLSLSGMLLLQSAVLADEFDPSEVQSDEQDSEKLTLAEAALSEEVEAVVEALVSEAAFSESAFSESDSASVDIAAHSMLSDVDDYRAETTLALENLAQSTNAPQSILPYSDVLVVQAEEGQIAQIEEEQFVQIEEGQIAQIEEEQVAQAEEEQADSGIPGTFSGSVALTTNYVFRGITQTDNNPAIQGTLDYGLALSDKVGVYAGIFGSNVDFNDGDEASIEIDLYTGVAYQPTEKLSTSFTAFYYLYPGADSSLDYDYVEFVADATYDLETVALGATASYSPDNFASSGDAFYVEGRADVPLVEDLTLSAAVGYQTISDNAAFGAPDYLNWSVGLGYSISGFDLSLKYTDTNLSSTECFGGTDFCDARAVFTMSRSL